MARNETGLKEALALIPKLREEFWNNVNVPGSMQEENPFVNLKGSTKNAEDSRVWA